MLSQIGCLDITMEQIPNTRLTRRFCSTVKSIVHFKLIVHSVVRFDVITNQLKVDAYCISKYAVNSNFKSNLSISHFVSILITLVS